MNKELGTETKIFRDEVNSFLQDYDVVLSKNDRIRKINKQIISNLAEFDARVCFVMVVGSAKSGKSTFVNLMVGDELSPTDFLECTMLPSIIRGVDDTDISVERFYVKPAFISDEKNDIRNDKSLSEASRFKKIEEIENSFHEECFDKVIKYIKGVSSKEEILQKVDIKENLSCTKKDIKKYITASPQLEKDLLITVINVPKNDFLNGEVAIIDMPGIDGAKSNMNMPVYSFISAKADYVVFIQSTVAALTNTSAEYISENLSNKKGRQPPTALIQNSFDATWWQEEKEKEKKAQEHIKVAREYLSENGIEVKSPKVINLGLAKEEKATLSLSNTIHSNVNIDSLIQEEKKKVEDFYNSLISEFSSDSKKIMISNVLNGIRGNLKDLEDNLYYSKKDAVVAKDKLKSERNDIESKKEGIREKVSNYNSIALELKSTPNSEDIKKAIMEDFNNNEPNIKRSRKVSEFKEECAKFYKAINVKLDVKIKENISDLRKEIYEAFVKIEKENELINSLNDKDKAALNVSLRESFEQNDVLYFNFNKKWEYNDADGISKPNLGFWKCFKGVFGGEVDEADGNKILESIKTSTEENFNEYFENYRKDFDSNFKNICKKRKELFEDVFSSFFEDLSKAKQNEIIENEERIRVYDDALERIKQLMNLVLKAKEENK